MHAGYTGGEAVMLTKLLFRVPRRLGVALLLAAFVQMVVALFAVRPGCISIDEVTYLAMARSFAAQGDFTIDNGYTLFPSPELESAEIRDVGGRLVAQYPYGFTVLAYPFWRAFGPSGLVVLNTFAFFGTVLLVYFLARHIHRRRAVAVLAASIFAFGTFAWSYSLALWPHATTTLLITGALYASLRERSLLAGVLAGIACTLRLDAVFVLPVVAIAPAISAGAPAPGPLLRVALGASPGFAFLAWVNHARWGAWQPLSYGPWHDAGSNTGLRRYAVLLGVAAVALVAAHLFASRLPRVPSKVWLVVVGLVLALLLARKNAWMILVDMRAFDGENEIAMTRGPRGEVVYIGAFKQALLQSLPWVPLAVHGLFGGGDRSKRGRAVLASAVLVYVVAFGLRGWHGGLCLDQRYLLPALPCLAVLAAYGFVRLVARTRGLVRRVREVDVPVFATFAAAFAGIVVARALPLGAYGVVVQDAPLVLTAGLAFALVLSRPKLALGLGLASFAMTILMLVGLAAPVTLARRGWNARVADRIADDVVPGELVFVDLPEVASSLLARGVRLADIHRDGAAGLPALAGRFCRARPCYAILTPKGADRVPALRVIARENGLVYGRIGTSLDTFDVPQ